MNADNRPGDAVPEAEPTVDPTPAPDPTPIPDPTAPGAPVPPAATTARWIVDSDADSELDRPDDARADRSELDSDHTEQVARWRKRSENRREGKKRPWWIELPILLATAFLLTFLIQTFVAKVYYVPSGSMETTLHGVESGGDRILVNKMVYDVRDPNPGDIVVFKGNDSWAPELEGVAGASTWYGKVFESIGSVVGIAPPDEKDFVKRVIAVGGQTIQCCDEQGNVVVDGVPLDEHYIYQPLPFTATDPTNNCTVDPSGLTYSSKRCFGQITVPEGYIFVMGDHRRASADSSQRCWGLTELGMRQNSDASQAVAPCVRLVSLDEVIGKAIFIVMPPSRWGTLGDPGIDTQANASAAMAPQALPMIGGLLLTAGLRGGLALTPKHRRRRRDHRSRRRQQAEADGS